MHDRRREHGRGGGGAGEGAAGMPGVGKRTLTQDLMAMPPGHGGPELAGRRRATGSPSTCRPTSATRSRPARRRASCSSRRPTASCRRWSCCSRRGSGSRSGRSRAHARKLDALGLRRLWIDLQPSYNILGKTDEAGHWQTYFDAAGYRQAAEQMVAGSNGPIHRLPESERAHVIDAMVLSMEHSDTSYFLRAIDHAHERGDVKSDPVYRVMTRGLAVESPWLHTNAIAGRHYHQGYAGTGEGGSGARWVSYREEAWKNRRLSEYQFRAVGEWFAEVYSAFYTPVEGQPKGALVREKLPETHRWFVAHVDNREAVARQAKAAHKQDKAPNKP